MDGTPDIAGLVITPDILKSVSKIDEFKGAWRAIGRIATERQQASPEYVSTSWRSLPFRVSFLPLLLPSFELLP
jgi:hypothetical protein